METITSSNANGASVAYTYDGLNRLSTVVDNRLSGNNTTSYSYDAASNVAAASYPNGVQSAMTYDALNRITGLATQSTGYLYQRGPTGNLTGATELNGRTLNWSYDGIYRLTNEAVSADPDHVNGSVAYGLDPVGNRLSDTSSLAGVNSGSFGYNADDEVSTETYDNNGNTLATGGKNFTYDAENHLTGMSVSGTVVSIVYDAFGNRVAKTVNGVTTKYLVEDDVNPTGYPQVLDELTNGVVTRTYTYGLQRISQDQIVSNVWTSSFYGYDGGGNVRQLTSAAGAITDTYDYDAFGNKINSTGSTPNSYLYRGEEFDSDLGLYYLRARYMDPLTGRLLSRDPGNGEITEPATLHKYVYADSDPVNGSDPTGWEDAEAYPNLLARISVSAPVIAGLRAASAAIACALVWEGTKTYAETVAGPFGTVTMVAPCIWLARYYDSRTGTFCSADPLAGDPSDPQSWNRYPYGRNDPIDMTDPSGKHWWNWVLDIGIGAAVGWLAPELLPSVFGAGAASDVAVTTSTLSFEGSGIAITSGASVTVSAAVDPLATGLLGAGIGAEVKAATTPQTPTTTQPQAPKKNCPPVPQHPKGTDVDANIRATQATYNADPTGNGAKAWWVNQVKTNGAWDYKTQGIKYDDFGNFNYGATGAVFGFSSGTLQAGAVGARLLKSPLSQLKNYGLANPAHKNDMIRQGMQYKQNDCGKF